MTQQASPMDSSNASAPKSELEIWQRICSRASELLGTKIQFGQFAIGDLFVFWKGEPQPDGSVPPRGVTVWERGKPAPIKSSLGVMALFGAEEDFVRIYCLPIDASDRTVIGPACVTLSCTSPVPSLFLQYMPLGQFIEKIAHEVASELVGDDEEDADDTDEEEGADRNGFKKVD
jgi:hypothetical protein